MPPTRRPRGATKTKTKPSRTTTSQPKSPAAAPEPPAPHPIFNTTYTLHRLSPLHNFPTLTPRALAPHAKTLLTQLRGDILRGVRLYDTTDVLDGQASRAGKLVGVRWDVVEQDVDRVGVKGVKVTVEYEKAKYTALLLRGSNGGDEEAEAEAEKEGFTHLPLLLSRIPKTPRMVLESYLTTTFDAVMRPLTLPSRFVRTSVESWIRTVGGNTAAAVEIVLTPPLTTTTTTATRKKVDGLSKITLSIDGADVKPFWDRGREINQESPFWSSVEAYCLATTGLDLDVKKGMEVVKIGTGGFVIASNKWKGFVPRTTDEVEAAGEMVRSLVKAAEGGGAEEE